MGGGVDLRGGKMRALIYTMALFTLMIGGAFAQGSPLSCRIAISLGTPMILCNVTENNIVIQDIVLNRGNCRSPKEWAEHFGVEYPVGKSFKFGDRISIKTGKVDESADLSVSIIFLFED